MIKNTQQLQVHVCWWQPAQHGVVSAKSVDDVTWALHWTAAIGVVWTTNRFGIIKLNIITDDSARLPSMRHFPLKNMTWIWRWKCFDKAHIWYIMQNSSRFNLGTVHVPRTHNVTELHRLPSSRIRNNFSLQGHVCWRQSAQHGVVSAKSVDDVTWALHWTAAIGVVWTTNRFGIIKLNIITDDSARLPSMRHFPLKNMTWIWRWKCFDKAHIWYIMQNSSRFNLGTVHVPRTHNVTELHRLPSSRIRNWHVKNTFLLSNNQKVQNWKLITINKSNFFFHTRQTMTCLSLPVNYSLKVLSKF